MHYINVVISETSTIPAKAIRLFTRSRYNHTSFSLDNNFDEFYSFARKNASSPLYGGFVKEHASYYSLGKNKDVNVRVFRIPITNIKLKKLKNKLEEMENDNEYLYNLFSVLFYPFHLSFGTYKAYYCSEFVVTILKTYTSIRLTKKPYKYSPKDVDKLLKKHLWYEGPISTLSNITKVDDIFYNKLSLKSNLYKSFVISAKLLIRKIKY